MHALVFKGLVSHQFAEAPRLKSKSSYLKEPITGA